MNGLITLCYETCKQDGYHSAHRSRGGKRTVWGEGVNKHLFTWPHHRCPHNHWTGRVSGLFIRVSLIPIYPNLCSVYNIISPQITPSQNLWWTYHISPFQLLVSISSLTISIYGEYIMFYHVNLWWVYQISPSQSLVSILCVSTSLFGEYIKFHHFNLWCIYHVLPSESFWVYQISPL